MMVFTLPRFTTPRGLDRTMLVEQLQKDCSLVHYKACGEKLHLVRPEKGGLEVVSTSAIESGDKKLGVIRTKAGKASKSAGKQISKASKKGSKKGKRKGAPK